MRKNNKLFNVVVLFIVIIMMSFSVFAETQETTSGYVPPQETTEFNDMRENVLSQDPFAEVNYLNLLETFIYDMDCHPDISVDSFLSAQIGKPFQVPRADNDGNISISESVFYIPIFNGSDVLATINVGVAVDGEHSYTLSSGYSKGLTRLLADTSKGDSTLLLATDELGIIGTNGRTIIGLVNADIIHPDSEIGVTDGSNSKNGLPTMTVGTLFDNLKNTNITAAVDILAHSENVDQTVSQSISDFSKTQSRAPVAATPVVLPFMLLH